MLDIIQEQIRCIFHAWGPIEIHLASTMHKTLDLFDVWHDWLDNLSSQEWVMATGIIITDNSACEVRPSMAGLALKISLVLNSMTKLLAPAPKPILTSQ
jgi:hypothetical protein